MAVDDNDNLWLINDANDLELIKYNGSDWEALNYFPKFQPFP